LLVGLNSHNLYYRLQVQRGSTSIILILGEQPSKCGESVYAKFSELIYFSLLGDQKKRQCKSGFSGKKLAFSKLNVILGLHKSSI
jgi:hypothetical protein